MQDDYISCVYKKGLDNLTKICYHMRVAWVWRSLVACLNGVQEAGSSNLLTQTRASDDFNVSSLVFCYKDINAEFSLAFHSISTHIFHLNITCKPLTWMRLAFKISTTSILEFLFLGGIQNAFKGQHCSR